MPVNNFRQSEKCKRAISKNNSPTMVGNINHLNKHYEESDVTKNSTFVM